MTTRPNMIAVGDNCLDVYLTRNVMTVGGNALNVAVHWHRAGVASRYFGAVGDDAEGGVICDGIEGAGLIREDVERRHGHTAVTLLGEVRGDRKILFEDLGVGIDYMPAQYGLLADADWVHLGTNAYLSLVQRLIADRIPFSVDISTAHRALPLQGIPLVFASGPEDEAEPVEPLVGTLRAAGASQLVITCGSRGAFFSDGGALVHAPAQEVAVIDTCGAGDSFIAGFLRASRSENRPPMEALRMATAEAARTCLYVGGFPQTPRRIPNWLLEKYADVISPAEGR